jgi:hypothetical protein
VTVGGDSTSAQGQHRKAAQDTREGRAIQKRGQAERQMKVMTVAKLPQRQLRAVELVAV